MTTGQLIRMSRKRAGLTQKELGEKLNISYVNISQLENDQRSPGIDTLQKIAVALGVHLSELIEHHDYDEESVKWAEQVFSHQKDYDNETITKAKDILLHAGPGVIWINPRDRIIDIFEVMTLEGQEKVADYAEDILPRYRAPDAPQPPAEPQESTDTTPPQEGSEGPPEGK